MKQTIDPFYDIIHRYISRQSYDESFKQYLKEALFHENDSLRDINCFFKALEQLQILQNTYRLPIYTCLNVDGHIQKINGENFEWNDSVCREVQKWLHVIIRILR